MKTYVFNLVRMICF